ncbi:MAG: gamma-glutamyl-gamma-aminobutyrate hydrolase family protein [Ignavibacteriae bacterium]|nr:gamma-glutamyl-gamma-aminobutyrate hydrolase family protein [Ignavibacteriota bacterium]MCB9216906.1 gamma-glutamyl-gamma-aminobutyrate hydrolase family protein [Ignavibacteria bacterium]
MSITIGLSRGSGSPKYQNYWDWILNREPDAKIVDLYEAEDLESLLPELDAVVMTGGGDIDPERYGEPEAFSLCSGIDEARDSREYRTLEYAFQQKIPVLGICRGIQIVNVYLGGTLIPHIPDFADAGGYHGKVGEEDNAHDIHVEPGSLLARATQEAEGRVNSSHHQGVGRLASKLTATAYSPDRLIEAVEWLEPEQRSYLLAVQWHPERMENLESPFSARILDQFLIEAHSSRIYKATTPPEPKPEPEEIEITPEDNESGGLFPIIQG